MMTRGMVVLWIIALGAGCTGNAKISADAGPKPDSVSHDAVPGADVGLSSADSEVSDKGIALGTDAAATPCGTQDCESAFEVCVVVGPEGPAEQPRCKPVSDACTLNRTCACLQGVFCPPATTTGCVNRAPNVILCQRGR